MSIIYLLILKVILSQVSADIDTGSICGTVTDTRGNPLVGATVMIVGTAYGAMTDPFGLYGIENLAAGKYTVEARMVGMLANTVDGVEVVADCITTQGFSLATYGLSADDIPVLIKI
ncbi:MAG: carboxypeptidase regulatory-like domain-containing protein [Candidatus Sabulitectum sp.]|nr:carboxypeptidase regulatory-like domain-containing protein [Candidatus Sabulitectum sp.]